MILIDPTEKQAIRAPCSALTSCVQHNLYLAHTLDSIKQPSFFSPPPCDSFSIPQQVFMWNIEDRPIPDSPEEKENDHHPSHFAPGLHKGETTLQEYIDTIQSNQASPQGQPKDPTETRILIQAAQTQRAALGLKI